MKSDIPLRKVTEIAVAITPEGGDANADIWEVYLINLKPDTISNVIVSSEGFGVKDGSSVKTTVIRRFFEHISSHSVQRVEPISRELFGIANQFWVSFTHDGYMYDKKYTFVAGSISSDNFTQVPFLEKPGVMIL